MQVKVISVLSTAAVVLLLASSVSTFDDPISFIGRVKWNYTNFEEALWNIGFENTTIPQIYRQHVPFFLAQIGNNVSLFPTNLTNSTNDLPKMVDLWNATNHVNKVWNVYANFSRWYSTKRVEAEIVSSIDEIPALEESMKRLRNDSYQRIFFDFFQYRAAECKHSNENETIMYRMVENYFTEMIATELKCYILLQLAYFTQASENFAEYHARARKLRIEFKSHYNQFSDETENLVWSLSRDVWMCDNTASGSYTQFTNFIQGYVDNKVNMNPSGTCTGYCKDYSKTRNYDCKKDTLCAANYFDRNKTRCDGVIRDCDYFGTSMSYCANEDDTVIDRRVNFVKLDTGKVLGQEIFCPDKVHLKSWMSWLSTCNYCFCYCDAPGPRSDRYVSLREIVSNITENKVLTGFYFIKQNGILHLRGIERSLLPNARVNTSESNVVSNDKFQIFDQNVKQNEDYFELTYEERSMNLDTIVGTRDQLVTGVRFAVNNGRLIFQARLTYFDESVGKLDISVDSKWISNMNPERELIPLGHLNTPIEAPRQSHDESSSDRHFIEFGPTGWMHDMAQTTVPFFDAQPVESNDNKAVSGVGIFYKASPGFAGFVAPKIVVYDRAETVLRIRAAVGVYGV